MTTIKSEITNFNTTHVWIRERSSDTNLEREFMFPFHSFLLTTSGDAIWIMRVSACGKKLVCEPHERLLSPGYFATRCLGLDDHQISGKRVLRSARVRDFDLAAAWHIAPESLRLLIGQLLVSGVLRVGEHDGEFSAKPSVRGYMRRRWPGEAGVTAYHLNNAAVRELLTYLNNAHAAASLHPKLDERATQLTPETALSADALAGAIASAITTSLRPVMEQLLAQVPGPQQAGGPTFAPSPHATR